MHRKVTAKRFLSASSGYGASTDSDRDRKDRKPRARGVRRNWSFAWEALEMEGSYAKCKITRSQTCRRKGCWSTKRFERSCARNETSARAEAEDCLELYDTIRAFLPGGIRGGPPTCFSGRAESHSQPALRIGKSGDYDPRGFPCRCRRERKVDSQKIEERARTSTAISLLFCDAKQKSQ